MRPLNPQSRQSKSADPHEADEACLCVIVICVICVIWLCMKDFPKDEFALNVLEVACPCSIDLELSQTSK